MFSRCCSSSTSSSSHTWCALCSELDSVKVGGGLWSIWAIVSFTSYISCFFWCFHYVGNFQSLRFTISLNKSIEPHNSPFLFQIFTVLSSPLVINPCKLNFFSSTLIYFIEFILWLWTSPREIFLTCTHLSASSTGILFYCIDCFSCTYVGVFRPVSPLSRFARKLGFWDG